MINGSDREGSPARPPANKSQTRVVRVVHFSAGGRYARADLSESENLKLFGPLMAEKGFGYNYKLEAHFAGPVDAETGMIENLMQIDRWLAIVTGQLDHRFFNRDIPHFRLNPPTVENVAAYCLDQIAKEMTATQRTEFENRFSAVRLVKVRLFEGESTWADVYHADATDEDLDFL